MNLRAGLAVLCLFALSGCGSMPPAQDLPAVIVQPTAQGREELQQTVTSALHGAPVTLAEDALTHASVLIIERTAARDANGAPLQGRELGRPEKFQLVKNASHCVLIHEGSGQRYTLSKIHCAPL